MLESRLDIPEHPLAHMRGLMDSAGPQVEKVQVEEGLHTINVTDASRVTYSYTRERPTTEKRGLIWKNDVVTSVEPSSVALQVIRETGGIPQAEAYLNSLIARYGLDPKPTEPQEQPAPTGLPEKRKLMLAGGEGTAQAEQPQPLEARLTTNQLLRARNEIGYYADARRGTWKVIVEKAEKAGNNLDRQPADIQFVVGIAYDQIGEVGKAVTHLNNYVARNTESVKGHMALAGIYERLQSEHTSPEEVGIQGLTAEQVPTKLLDHLKAAAKYGSKPAHTKLKVIYETRATELGTEANLPMPDNTQGLSDFRQADRSESGRKFDDAERLYGLAIQRAQNDDIGNLIKSQSYIGLGNMHLQKGNLTGALAMYTQSVSIKETVEGLKALAEVHERLSK